MRAILAALVASFVVGTAVAHVSSDTEVQSASVGGRFLYFATEPGTVYAGEDVFALLSVSNRDFSPAANLTVEVEAANASARAVERFAGRYQAPIAFEDAGRHAVRWTFPSENGTAATWTVNVTAYPDLGIALTPVDELADYYENGTYEIGVYVVNRSTGAPDPRVEDLRFRLEHWTDDHKTLLGSEDVVAEPRDGAWWITHTFRERGMYHVYVASESLGMDFGDAPYLHYYAANALPATEPPKTEETPAPLALGVAAAAVAAALARRKSA